MNFIAKLARSIRLFNLMILFSSPICTYVALIDREKKDDKTVTVLRRKGIKGILIHF